MITVFPPSSPSRSFLLPHLSKSRLSQNKQGKKRKRKKKKKTSKQCTRNTCRDIHKQNHKNTKSKTVICKQKTNKVKKCNMRQKNLQ